MIKSLVFVKITSIIDSRPLSMVTIFKLNLQVLLDLYSTDCPNFISAGGPVLGTLFKPMLLCIGIYS